MRAREHEEDAEVIRRMVLHREDRSETADGGVLRESADR